MWEERSLPQYGRKAVSIYNQRWQKSDSYSNNNNLTHPQLFFCVPVQIVPAQLPTCNQPCPLSSHCLCPSAACSFVVLVRKRHSSGVLRTAQVHVHQSIGELWVVFLLGHNKSYEGFLFPSTLGKWRRRNGLKQGRHAQMIPTLTSIVLKV